jgi:cyclophilin family peptidyl-prolyl cis-trans isomerase
MMFCCRPARNNRRLVPSASGIILEERELLTAGLAPIGDISVPALLGYQVPLDGSSSTAAFQTFTVSSDNPDIPASIAQGPFWTLRVTHTASSTPGDVSFSGALTFQLFQDLTPVTVARFTQFTTSGYYNGKNFFRIVGNAPGPTDYLVQGGSASPDGTGLSHQPGTPFPLEIVQQLAFTGKDQLAVAAKVDDTQLSAKVGDTQFSILTRTKSPCP